MIELKKCYKKYNNTNVINDLSIKFPDKGLYVILGKSGSGKTTLLNIISGNLIPDSGDVYYNNKNIYELSSSEKQGYAQNHISYIFQDFFLLDSLTVKENILLGEAFKISSDVNLKDICNRLEIKSLMDKYPNTLSGGERQRVSIARALYKNTPIVLADEPTGNLDFESTDNVYKILKEIAKDKLVITVSHDTDIVKYADGIIDYKNIEKNYDFSNSTSCNNVDFTYTNKTPNIGIKMFAKKLKPIKYFSLLISFSLLILFLILNISVINPHKEELKMYLDNNIEEINYESLGKDPKEINYNNLEFSTIKPRKYYENATTYGLSGNKEETNLSYWLHLDYIIIDDNIKDDSFVMSNYIKDELLKNYDFKDENDILNNSKYIYGNIKYDLIGFANNFKYPSLYSYNYSYILMSQKSYDKILNQIFDLEYFRFYVNSLVPSSKDVADLKVTKNIDYITSITSGRMPEKEDEVLVTKGILADYFNIGDEVKFGDKVFKIVGTCTSNKGYVFYMDEKPYDELYFELTKSDTQTKGFIVDVVDDKSFLKFSETMYKNGFTPNCSISYKVRNLLDFIYTFKNSTIGLLFIICIFEFILSILVMNNLFKAFKNEIIIFYSLGASFKQVTLTILKPLFILFSLLSIISIILYISFMPLISTCMKIILHVDVNLLHLHPIILLSIVFESVLFILFGLLMILRLKKKNIIDLLYNRA